MKFIKKFFIVLFVFTTGIIQAQTESISTANGEKSWTLETKSSIYQIGLSDQGIVGMYYFGNKSQDLTMLRRPLGEEVTVRGGDIRQRLLC